MESVVSESKFLRVDSLVELVKALIAASPEPNSTSRVNIDTAIFLLEMLIKVFTTHLYKYSHISAIRAVPTECNLRGTSVGDKVIPPPIT